MKKFSILLFSVVMFPLGINAHEQDTLKTQLKLLPRLLLRLLKSTLFNMK